MAPGTEQAGRFVHVPWDASPQLIDKPNEYTDLPIAAEDRSLRRTVIVRIHGAVDDPSAGFPWEDNYVITEDHYIDYLSGRSAEEVVPGQILAKLKKLGRAKYWAIERDPDVLERDLWQQAGVGLYQSNLIDYIRGLYGYLDHHLEEALPWQLLMSRSSRATARTWVSITFRKSSVPGFSGAMTTATRLSQIYRQRA
jgi:hypothetical protein